MNGQYTTIRYICAYDMIRKVEYNLCKLTCPSAAILGLTIKIETKANDNFMLMGLIVDDDDRILGIMISPR